VLITLAALLLFALIVYAFMQQPQFGRAPQGKRLERIRQSPNFRDGKFHNLSPTPDLTNGATYFSVLREFLSAKPRRIPSHEIPHTKTDLKTLPADEDVLVWFGHSSYFMQIDGKKVLVDPVLSGAASPVAFTTREFKGTGVYRAADLPEIDYLFITHDHWDHIDYKTLMELKPRVKQIITGLGTGAHFERWGFDPARILEQDWNESAELGDGFTVHATPARHFSGRGFIRNRALWMSFVLKTPTMNIFIGGDSGYDTHFAEIGKKFGPFDLAILENGQYDKSWQLIHAMPEEVVQAAQDLQAKRFIPVHCAKFALGNHAWDEPLNRVAEASKNSGIPMLTPMIGEKVMLKESTQVWKEWWRNA
jgi:L-ascorbate metabolism protein UlaG (beta-lactamase superfamily)